MKSYDVAKHIKTFEDSAHLYRGADFAQPKALVPGDSILTTQYYTPRKIMSPPEVLAGGVLLEFDDTCRIVPAILPLLLESAEQKAGLLPHRLQIGRILQTGHIVLSDPQEVEDDETSFLVNHEEVALHVTGGGEGDLVRMPADLLVAILPKVYPYHDDSPIGQLAVEQLLKMDPAARQNFPAIEQPSLPF